MSQCAAPRIVLGLGANIGAPRRQLLAAVAALSRELGPLTVAPLYRSAAVSPIAQPEFLNTVVLARSDWQPERLLALAKDLEAQAGRVEGPRWGPRPLDVDLLLVGELRHDDVALTLPHPRLRERGFVLAPLADIAPDLRLPPRHPDHPDHPDGRTAADMLAALPREAWPVRVPWTADEHGR
ncbi:MAG TPA: 2-amino-4-hydroxy-6-hydroxymethyldihydropteridine diphosphokinase [Thermoanaerobaculia bacterium]|nr:2-amino-4-hydroxy-6-hydroxymethyldihydropteridine diphosphokinase [Thermoanaerobaculia bacterium]